MGGRKRGRAGGWEEDAGLQAGGVGGVVVSACHEGVRAGLGLEPWSPGCLGLRAGLSCAGGGQL